LPRCSLPVERMPLSTRLRNLVEGAISFSTSRNKQKGATAS
jgi:hypothetical protein